MKYKSLFLGLLIPNLAFALDTPISGVVQSKCSVYTDRAGVYAQPLPNTLSTAPNNGGVLPKVRYDVAQADYYLAKISWPIEFSSSPSLSDSVTWTGEVSVAEVTDQNMSAYDSNKIEYNNVTEYDLTVAGTTWFSITSTAAYGYDKSFPAGNYTALVTAECIAK
jgi:hypothetical protein